MASLQATEAVTKLWPVFEYHARILNGVGGAEFDDLVQEGALASWLALEQGYTPSNKLIQRAMKDWIRFVSHRGLTSELFEPLDET